MNLFSFLYEFEELLDKLVNLSFMSFTIVLGTQLMTRVTLAVSTFTRTITIVELRDVWCCSNQKMVSVNMPGMFLSCITVESFKFMRTNFRGFLKGLVKYNFVDLLLS